MVARRFVVRQAPAGEEHAVDYDTEDGLDVLRFQIFSLTSVPPDLQKVRSPPGPHTHPWYPAIVLL
jgi:peptide-N4-(N-acetyl-beta-glucosaminyl)asparagine amidase